MSRPYAVAILAAIGLLLLAAMWWGWRGKVRRTGAGLAPLPAPWEPAADSTPIAGIYVSSTNAGEWLDRVAAAGLGVKSPVEVHVDERGVLLLRRGAPDVAIPSDTLLAVRRERGIAGKVADPGGLVVIRWRLGERELDTGVRPRFEADRDRLITLVTPLIDPAAAPGAQLAAKDTPA